MQLSTKSKNLEILKNLNLKRSYIPNFISIKVQEWNKNYKIIKNVKSKLNDKLSIRSSFYLEDNKNSSMAGEFDSFLDIKNNKENISYRYFSHSLMKSSWLTGIIIFNNLIFLEDFPNINLLK